MDSTQTSLGDSLPSVFSVELKEIDTVVMNVLTKFVQRSKFGKQKYGTDLDRTDLSVLDWIQHAQEEHMDAILYLEKLKQTVSPASK
jgi:hypothetical protein